MKERGINIMKENKSLNKIKLQGNLTINKDGIN